ncbi:hypothetical protein PENSUB_13304 [Penicillium subrubescens]|uniref:Uncharacterized protein n=2 Tax=Penicillium subrubescens TaxID=1316194 RepID=A0A1Q5SRG2_9EURO|nr:hypothetical protein PENSUB_13304 [Penicillium subrubescens]
MLDQSRQSTPSLEFLEPISDDEEEGIEGYQEELQEEELDNERNELVLSYSLKRPVDIADLDDYVLQGETALDSTEARTSSGRIRKKPRLPDGFEVGKP